MSQPARHLRAIDGNGELIEDVTPVPSDVALLTEELIDLRRKLSAVQAKNTRLAKVSPKAEQIADVLEHWHTTVKAGSKRVKIPVDGARWKAVAAMLRHYDAEQLKACVDVVAARPFMQYDRRYASPGPGRVRRDDITLMFRDERHVEELLAMSDEAVAERDAYARWLHGLCVSYPKLVKMLAYLAREREPHPDVLVSCALWCKEQAS